MDRLLPILAFAAVSKREFAAEVDELRGWRAADTLEALAASRSRSMLYSQSIQSSCARIYRTAVGIFAS